MTGELAAKSCVPCQGGIPPLARAAAEAYLRQTPGWALVDDGRRLERKFKFNDFAEAMAFVTAVGALAEVQGHHPDISFGWGWATVSWQTHKIKGLHENDFVMAAKTGQLAEAR
jgi:4a-hydroxytetrahydrobiopterin dehydratase